MSGLLLGILLARTFSGLIAEAAGWRTRSTRWPAEPSVSLSAVLTAGSLPGESARRTWPTRSCSPRWSTSCATEPLLRLRSAIGGLAFATFNVIWTSLAFLLAGPPYHYGEAVIGLFGLLGAAGALAASVQRAAGRPRASSGGSPGARCCAVLAAVGPARLRRRTSCGRWSSASSSPTLGIQAVHIQNQQLIFAIDPSARSRLNTGYMVTYFLGGAIGSATTGLAYESGRWTAVGVLGVVYSAAALVVWAVGEVTGIGHRRVVSLAP